MTAADDSSMSAYEARAWKLLVEEAQKPESEPGRYDGLAQGIKSQLGDIASQAGQNLRRLPGADQAFRGLDALTKKALVGLHVTFVERGLNSVNPAAIFSTFAKEGVQVSSFEEIRDLDLRYCDQTVPRRKERYLLLALGQGALAAAIVTGAEVSGAVSKGATLRVAAGAVGADVSATLVGMGRIVALVAAHYGYDARLPEEQVFASGVLTYSTASGAAEKAASLAALSRLTQRMMRRATWAQLRKFQMVNVIQRVVTALGFKLTKKKLARAVPVAGVVVNGGLNARLAQNTFTRAQQAYRLRFLSEKYDLDPDEWSPEVLDAEVTDLPLVDEILEIEAAGESPVGDPDEIEGDGDDGGGDQAAK